MVQPRKQQQRRKSGPHNSTRQFQADWNSSYPNEKKRQLASKAEITGWISDLERDLAMGYTKTREVISPALAAEIRKHIDRLKERLRAPDSKKKIKDGGNCRIEVVRQAAR